MTRHFSRWKCPCCGHHVVLYVAPSEPPTCIHIGTCCRQKVARMVLIEEPKAAT
jgi:ribosomal protein S27E